MKWDDSINTFVTITISLNFCLKLKSEMNKEQSQQKRHFAAYVDKRVAEDFKYFLSVSKTSK